MDGKPDGRIHVLFFTTSLGGGGAEKHLVRIANALDRERFSVSVAVLRPGGAFEKELADDVTYYPLNIRRMAFAVHPLRALMNRISPAVMCSMMDHANIIAILASGRRKDGPAVILGVQNPPSIDLRRPPNRFRKRAVLAMIPWLYPRADHVVALSEGVQRELLELVPGLHGRITVIPNAGFDGAVVRLAAESPIEDHLRRSAKPIMVACGRLTEQKGYPYLFEAFRRVRSRSPATLWILGEGELRSQLQAEAFRLGVADSVHFIGFRDNPHAYIRAADVFVLSSLWEGFGNVIVEAMAVGTPVVATDCPYGPAEIIRDGESGLLVPPRDPEALAVALQRILDEAGLRKKLAAGGQERSQAFTAQVVSSAYGRIFEQVSAARSCGPDRKGQA